jgi:hypothetical protein
MCNSRSVMSATSTVDTSCMTRRNWKRLSFLSFIERMDIDHRGSRSTARMCCNRSVACQTRSSNLIHTFSSMNWNDNQRSNLSREACAQVHTKHASAAHVDVAAVAWPSGHKVGHNCGIDVVFACKIENNQSNGRHEFGGLADAR